MILDKIKLIYRRIACSANWNIGFCECTSQQFIESRGIGRVQWMKHDFKDRFFADPFIVDITDDRIILLVEECPFENPRGIISELAIDKTTKRLIERRVLLKTDSHLSYPAIIDIDGKVYVYPENSQSGRLMIYEYDQVNHRLENPKPILNEPVTDATILNQNGSFVLVATKLPDSQKGAFVYASTSIFEHFHSLIKSPLEDNYSCSRPAGNWIKIENELYRPAQDCSSRYGGGIVILRVYLDEDSISEKAAFSLYPNSFRYNRGLHTINFKESMCVVDGYGYLYPVTGRILNLIMRLFKH